MREVQKIVRIAVFHGEHLLLVPSEYPQIDTCPLTCIGLPSQKFWGDDDWQKEVAVRLAHSRIRIRGQMLTLREVDRMYVSEDSEARVPEHVFLYSCDFFGYREAIAVKPEKLPANVDPMQIPVIERVITWRRYMEWG